jgi:hypothetical protein
VKAFVVSSLVGMDTGKPIVKIEFEGTEVRIETGEARALALNILSCAEAAEQDLCIYRFLTERCGVGHDEAAITLGVHREFRHKITQLPGSETLG